MKDSYVGVYTPFSPQTIHVRSSTSGPNYIDLLIEDRSRLGGGYQHIATLDKMQAAMLRYALDLLITANEDEEA